MTNHADIIDQAADYIEQHGWFQGNFYSGHVYDEPLLRTIKMEASTTAPAMCAMGAVAVSCANWGEYEQVHDMLAKTLGDTVATWNDYTAKDKDEVVEFLRIEALKIRMGNIGDDPKEYEFEPIPTTEPVKEPAAPQPVKEPQPV